MEYSLSKRIKRYCRPIAKRIQCAILIVGLVTKSGHRSSKALGIDETNALAAASSLNMLVSVLPQRMLTSACVVSARVGCGLTTYGETYCPGSVFSG